MAKDVKTSEAQSDELKTHHGFEDKPFEITPQMQKYIDLKAAAGVIVPLETEVDRHRFMKEYSSWVKAGKPLPKLPDLKLEEDPVPMKLYRIKHLGLQKIFWRDTAGTMHGKEIIVEQYQISVEGPDGKPQQAHRTREKVEYTTGFTKEVADKLARDALDRCNHPTFSMIYQDRKWGISADDFVNGNFDNMLGRVIRGGVIG